jgi:alpha-ketoglutarate-dependent taurine dioxygenase
MFTLNELKDVKDELNTTGLVIRNNRDLNKEDLKELGRKISPMGKLLKWNFGDLMEMKYNPDNSNYLFSDEEVPLHWDGAFHKEPSYIIFYCTQTSEVPGGESLFVNTTELYKALSNTDKNSANELSISYTTEKLAHYGGTINVPLKQIHPRTEQDILRFAQEVHTQKNPVTRKVTKGEAHLCKRLDEMSRQSEFTYEHTWQKGDLLIVDNFTYIHGRKPLRKNKERSFYRVQAL